MAQLVEDGHGPSAVGGHEDLLRQAELGEEVRLDGPGTVGRRAADVRQRVERVDVAKDDGLHLGDGPFAPGARPLDAVEHGAAEAPLDHRVDCCALLLDDRLDAVVQLVHAALHSHREERQDLEQVRRERHAERSGFRRDQLEAADDRVLVDEGRHDDASIAGGQHGLFRAGAMRIRLEVLDDQGLALQRGPLVDRPGEVADPLMHRVGEDARMLEARPEIEQQDPVALDRGEPQLDFRPLEQGPELGLELPEAIRRHDGLLVDEVPLEGGQHLLVGHFDGADDGEPADQEFLGGQHLYQGGRISEERPDPLPRVRRQRRRLPLHVDIEEAAIEEKLVVALEPRLGVGHDRDPWVFHAHVQAVHALEDERIGVHDPHVGQQGGVGLHPALEDAVGIGEIARESRRGIERLELERQHGGRVSVLVECRRHDGQHEGAQHVLVGPHDGGIHDRRGELRGHPDLVEHRARDLAQDRAAARHLLLPEPDERDEAELGPERKLA